MENKIILAPNALPVTVIVATTMMQDGKPLTESLVSANVCLNAAGSVKESTASSVRTCFIAIAFTVMVIFVKIAEHLLNALLLSVETNFAKNAICTFVMNVRRDFVKTVNFSVDVVSIQFVTVVVI